MHPGCPGQLQVPPGIPGQLQVPPGCPGYMQPPPGPPPVQLPPAPPAGGYSVPLAAEEQDVTYACEYCRTKYDTYAEAEACEVRCQQKQSQGSGNVAGQLPEASGTSPGTAFSSAQTMMQPPPASPGLPGGTPPMLPALLGGGQGALIGQALQILSAKGVLPGKGGGGSVATADAGKSLPPPVLPGASSRGATAPSAPPAATAETDPFLKGVQEFMDRWDVEHRFEPKLVSYLKRSGAGTLEDELKRLDKELEEAAVPPVCRSGYLLVVMGEVSEKSTDEDFRTLLTGKLSDKQLERDETSPSPQRAAASALSSTGSGGGGEKGAGSVSSSVPSVPPLPEGWMMEEVESSCARYNLDDKVKNRLVNAMRKRGSTFKEDMRTLNDVMRGARHPKGALSLKLREIENGTFSARSYSPLGPTPAELQDMERAAAKEKDKDRDKKKDKDKDKDDDSSRERRSRSRDRRRRSSRSRSRRRERDRE